MSIAYQADEEAITLRLSGKISGNYLGELRREIEKGRRMRKSIAIDLSEVTLVDRHVVEFLASQRRQEISLINCPVYIETWLDREPPVSSEIALF